MTEVFDCATTSGLLAGVAAALTAARSGGLVVMPTDTVYGIGCDAFDSAAVRALLDAKGRGPQMPPPVLIASSATVDGLARDVPAYARALIDEHWPGPLTVVLLAQPSLQWDLGETNGTVALRVPADPIAQGLLAQVGPMAVTSANRTGQPAATTVEQAREQLGEAVAVYLDGGPSSGGAPSTIVDCTGPVARILRVGAVPASALDLT
jgi:tRNA threonylcarbamoyl adenosine modification protein (Sua5/YciO/YrdC/YwlC family)